MNLYSEMQQQKRKKLKKLGLDIKIFLNYPLPDDKKWKRSQPMAGIEVALFLEDGMVPSRDPAP